MRARDLASRRAGGEQLGDYETRLLEAHLAGCGRCREFTASLATGAAEAAPPAAVTVGGGKAPVSGGKVAAVEEPGPQGRRPEDEERIEETERPEDEGRADDEGTEVSERPVEDEPAPTAEAEQPAPEPAAAGAGGDEEGGRSTVDAMGQDKHRRVIGQTWGPTRARQLAYYGGAVIVIILLYVGASFAVDELDKAPKKDRDQAPWSKPDVPQKPPQRFL